jgi:hypothetical protein
VQAVGERPVQRLVRSVAAAAQNGDEATAANLDAAAAVREAAVAAAASAAAVGHGEPGGVTAERAEAVLRAAKRETQRADWGLPRDSLRGDVVALRHVAEVDDFAPLPMPPPHPRDMVSFSDGPLPPPGEKPRFAAARVAANSGTGGGSLAAAGGSFGGLRRAVERRAIAEVLHGVSLPVAEVAALAEYTWAAPAPEAVPLLFCAGTMADRLKSEVSVFLVCRVPLSSRGEI